MESDVRVINDMVKRESELVDRIVREVGNVIVGQSYMVERVLVGLLTGGHILLEGVPGLAKTLTVKTISDTIHTQFQRLQFTPDLLPADLIGTMIYDPRSQTFNVKKGPIFANLILADEVNRAPAKVQSAMLEAMQEHQVTIGDTTFTLPEPFIVMATQNPIEQEGTYPLPEAQIDRFMLKLKVGYPSKEDELTIMNRMTSGQKVYADKVVTPDEILQAREVVSQVYLDDKIKQYIIDITFATRFPDQYGLGKLTDYISFGASPRASIYLNQAARAHAFLRHRGYVIPEDIKSVGLDILRHRVILTYEAEAEELSSEDIIQQIFDNVEVP